MATSAEPAEAGPKAKAEAMADGTVVARPDAAATLGARARKSRRDSRSASSVENGVVIREARRGSEGGVLVCHPAAGPAMTVP